jgi:hypothetical protein
MMILKVRKKQFSGGTKEIHKKPQPVELVSGPRYEPGTS